MISLPVSLPTELLEKVDSLVKNNPAQFRPANRKTGKGSRAELVRQAVIFFVDRSDVLKTDHTYSVTDLSDGALTAYPPHNPRVNILRDPSLMDLIEQSDLPESVGEAEEEADA